MSDFFRFPHTPHLAWLGEGSPRDDKVLSKQDTASLLAHDVVVEEKIDGANIGISVGPEGKLRVQNRGQYLAAPYAGQFARLSSWLPRLEDDLIKSLSDNLILFGEWCAARHSLDYSKLADWFLAFDVYDRREGRFWSTSRRDVLANRHSVQTVPKIYSGPARLAELERLVLEKPSQFRSGTLEGIVIRQESSEWLESRAKLVHPNFTQAITEHWSRRGLHWNHLRDFPPLTEA